MYCTGDPDRAPVRCTEPTGYAHTGPEAAFAALTALWTGVPQRVDVSMQEVVLVANMATPARFPQTGFRGSRRGAEHRQDPRDLADDRRVRLLRLAAARRGSESRADLEAGRIAAARPGATSVRTPRPTTSSRRSRPRSARTSRTFHARALRPRVRNEPLHARPDQLAVRDFLAVAQLAARDFFGPIDNVERFPRSFVVVRSADGEAAAALPPTVWTVRRVITRSTVQTVGRQGVGRREDSSFSVGRRRSATCAYFAEHGATVLRVESKSRPTSARRRGNTLTEPVVGSRIADAAGSRDTTSTRPRSTVDAVLGEVAEYAIGPAAPDPNSEFFTPSHALPPDRLDG